MSSSAPDDSRLVPVDFDPFAEPTEGQAVPLTEAQREIWAAVQMGPEASCAYNQCYALRLVGQVSTDALRGAIQLLLDRHESLRMTFDPAGEWQVPSASQLVNVPLVDLSCLAGPERKARLEDVLAREVEIPFDLASGPPARAQVLLEAADRCLVVFTAHHIVCDGGSGRLLFRELAILYAALRRDESPDLPPPLKFSDFVRQEKGEAGEARAREALAYWRGQFADVAPSLDLPLDRPRPPVKSYRGARQTLEIDAALTALLRSTAADQGCTMVVLLLATFQVLLHRLTGQPSVIVGLAASARSGTDGEGPVGHATNFLPLRIDVGADRPFTEHLLAVRSLLLDAQEHSALTFGTLVRELGLPRDPSRTPLVSCLFNLSRGDLPAEFPGAEAELFMPPRTHENFELEMQILDTNRTLVIDCTYSADLFDSGTMQRWLSHYRTLLHAIVAKPRTAVSTLPLLTGEQLSEQLEWNNTRAPYSEASVPELVSAQAKRTPERVAVEFAGRLLCYGDLEARAERLARRLRGRGVGPGARVGVYMERSPEMVVGVLGVLKAGGAYVPLDPAFPAERLAYMLEDSRAAVLLTHGEVAAEIPSRAVPVVRVDEEDGEPEASLHGDQVRLDDLAYVIYTSGSTGRPKGVGVTHRSLVNLLQSMGREPGLHEGDVLLSVTTLSFDIAALELYLPLIKGARVALASREETIDGRRLLDRLASSGATVMQATPATWQMLLESGWEGTAGLKVLCGGEALARDLAEDLLLRADEVWNVYGPTETTVWSSTCRVESDEGMISIGRPIANTQMWILDAQLNPQPVGVPGELYIGGVGVARGYFERPALTAERFVPDPFSEGPGARLYRTGDLAKWLPGGRLECLGRIDHQVKIRGFRIELGEIEAALREYAGVEQVVVVAQETAGGERRLVAFLVPGLAGAPPVTALRATLAQRLPSYMVPSAFVFLDSLPLTPNGKVDRRGLPTPGRDWRPQASQFTPPSTAAEETLCRIWAAVLETTQVGVEDNFFDLGGNSILLIRVIAQARQQGLQLTPLTMFRYPTVRSLAGHLSGQVAAEPSQAAARDRGRRQREAVARQTRPSRRG